MGNPVPFYRTDCECENASSRPCLFLPTVSLRSGAGDGCDVLCVGVSQQALHRDAHSPGKTFRLGLGVIVCVELWLPCQCVLHTVFFIKLFAYVITFSIRPVN